MAIKKFLFLELFARITGSKSLWGNRLGLNKVWQGTSPYIMLFDPETVEVKIFLTFNLINKIFNNAIV